MVIRHGMVEPHGKEEATCSTIVGSLGCFATGFLAFVTFPGILGTLDSLGTLESLGTLGVLGAIDVFGAMSMSSRVYSVGTVCRDGVGMSVCLKRWMFGTRRQSNTMFVWMGPVFYHIEMEGGLSADWSTRISWVSRKFAHSRPVCSII